MAKLLLNSNGKVLMDENGKVYKAPISSLKTLLDATKSTHYLFESYRGANVDDLIKYSDTENVTSMSYMFNQCTFLQAIPQLSTGKVISMRGMFLDCSSLTTIPQLDTSNVTIMNAMFQGCASLKLIPQLDTSNVTDMVQMFRNCYALTTIDMTNMKITSPYYTSLMCGNCYSLIKLIIRNMDTIPSLNSNAFTNTFHFNGTTNEIHNPQGLKDGKIYVPDNMVDSLKAATNWSAYADCIVPLSTLKE